MKLRLYTVLLIVGGLLLSTLPMQAQRVSSNRGGSRNSRTGLYSTSNYIASGITFGGGVTYYYGDADNTGVAFNGGFHTANVGGAAAVYYNYGLTFTHCLNLRFGLQGGLQRGNNKESIKKTHNRDDYRSFKTYFIEPTAALEFYPFSFLGIGFYIYGGVSFLAGVIDYDYAYYKRVDNQKVLSQLTGQTFGFLPIAQVGIGYSFPLSGSWIMSAELSLHEGLVDTYYMNIDAYPMAPSQNNDGVTIGRGAGQGKWEDADGMPHMRWDDGWFQFGLTVSRRFK